MVIFEKYKNKVKKSFLLSSIFTVASLDIINKILKSILIIILIRTLTIEEYSNYTLFISVSTFMFSFFANGLYTSYTLSESERISKTGHCSTKLFKNNLLIISCINFIIILINVFLMLKKQIPIMYLFANIYSFTICILELCRAYYLVNKDFKKSGKIVNDINIYITISLLIITLFNGINLNVVMIIHILTTGIFSIFNLRKIRTDIDKKDYSDLNIGISEYYKSSLWIIAYTGILAVFNQVDVFIIKTFLDSKEVAVYGVSFKYYTLMLSILPAIKTVLKIRTTQKDIVDNLEEQKKFMKMWIKKVSIISIPIIFIIILLAPLGLRILNGQQYDAAIVPFQIFCIGVAISYIFSPSSNILMAMKEYKFITVLAMLVCFFNIVGNTIIVNTLGVSGVVIITIISHAIINLVSTYKVLKL